MRLETGIGMNETAIYDMDDAVAALAALPDVFTYDLQVLEERIRSERRPFADPALAAGHEAARQAAARALLHSGLASITEVLGWIQAKTEEDPEGDVAIALRPLPTLRGCVIH
jgi:hypothetical protein